MISSGDLDEYEVAMFAVALLAHRSGGSVFIPVAHDEPNLDAEIIFNQDGITCNAKVITND